MATTLAPYCPAEFLSLKPDPTLSNALLMKAGGSDLVYSAFEALFKQHNMQDKFGLALLHRHFEMTQDERLVEWNGVATPWHIQDIASVKHDLDAVPRAWKFSQDGNKLVPYEFEAVVKRDAADQVDQHSELLKTGAMFLSQLHGLLKANGLDEVLGLRVDPGEGFKSVVERTFGRANVTFPLGTMSGPSIDTAYFFGPWTRSCRCTCGFNSDGSGHTNAHSGTHIVMGA